MTDEEIETLISQLLDAGFSGVLITNVINREQYKDVVREAAIWNIKHLNMAGLGSIIAITPLLPGNRIE